MELAIQINWKGDFFRIDGGDEVSFYESGGMNFENWYVFSISAKGNVVVPRVSYDIY